MSLFRRLTRKQEPPPSASSGPPRIVGEAALLEWYGEWPSFHDAEVLELHLSRSGRSTLKIHELYSRSAVVTFILEEITDLELADFSIQNVISGLKVNSAPDGGCRLTLYPCYGLAGYLQAKKVSVHVEPIST